MCTNAKESRPQTCLLWVYEMSYQYIWVCEKCDFRVKDTSPMYEYQIADHPHQLVKCKNLNYIPQKESTK